MQKAVYDEICRAVAGGFGVEDLLDMFPGIAYPTLFSIHTKQAQAGARAANGLLRTRVYRERMVDMLHAFLEVEGVSVVFALASEIQTTPLRAAQALLEELLAGEHLETRYMSPEILARIKPPAGGGAQDTPREIAREIAKEIVRDPDLLVDWARLSEEVMGGTAQIGIRVLRRVYHEIQAAIHCDRVFSPLCSSVRAYLGIAYERLLRDRLADLGVGHLPERDLRALSLAKTPDIMLETPVVVRVAGGGPHHVVRWIESKALFGDPETHAMYLDEQYYPYVNRFGPGLVIYWLGHVASAQQAGGGGDGQVMVCDHMPTDVVGCTTPRAD